jgi:hypothetical protein
MKQYSHCVRVEICYRLNKNTNFRRGGTTKHFRIANTTQRFEPVTSQMNAKQ